MLVPKLYDPFRSNFLWIHCLQNDYQNYQKFCNYQHFLFFICMDSYEKASQEKVELELRIKEAELREAALSAKVSSRIQ